MSTIPPTLSALSEPPAALATPAPTLPSWQRRGTVVAIALLLTLLTLLAAWVHMRTVRERLESEAGARAEMVARALEDQLHQQLGPAQAVLNALAISLADAAPGSLQALATAAEQQFITHPPASGTARSLNLLGPDGQVLASNVPANRGLVVPIAQLEPVTSDGLGPWLAARDLSELQAPGAPAPAIAPGAALPLVRLLPAPAGSTGSPRLVAMLPIDRLPAQLRAWLGDAPIRAAWIAGDGRVLAATEGAGRAPGSMLAPESPLRLAWRAQDQGRMVGPGLRGDEVTCVFRRVRRVPLWVVTEVPTASIEAELGPALATTAAMTSAALAVIGLLGYLAWRALGAQAQTRDALDLARGSMLAQHAFTDRMFQLSPIPIVVKDSEGRFVRVNNAWTDLTGMAPERVIGRTMRQLYPAYMATSQEQEEQRVLASGLPVSYEQQMLDADGLPRDVIVRVTPYTGHDGQLAGLISSVMDVSEFREAEVRTLQAKAAAERANTAKGEFLANISHELRTPLQSIIGFSELGLARAIGDARAQAMFKDIHLAGERMLALVNNLLDLSRMESTVGDIKLVAQDLVPALLAVRGELQPLADRKQLWLATPQNPTPLWVEADAFRLQQVMRNLLANAIRYAPEGSTVELGWRTLGDGSHIINVRDRGPGIPNDELDSIFGAFVQSSRTKSGAGGSGLGLAICRKIVQAHRGKIRAFNASNGGAVFEIRLPGVWPPAQAQGDGAALLDGDVRPYA